MVDKRLDGRKELIDRMRMEMLGPGSELSGLDLEHEIISGDPGQRYSVGILYPQGNIIGMEDDELDNKEGNAKEEIVSEGFSPEQDTESDNKEKIYSANDSEDSMDEYISMATKLLPSSMGFTFIAKQNLNQIVIDGKFAKYRVALVPDCKIRIDESIAEQFCVPEVFEPYFSYDKGRHILELKTKIEPKQIKYWYDREKADDGTFKN